MNFSSPWSFFRSFSAPSIKQKPIAINAKVHHYKSNHSKSIPSMNLEEVNQKWNQMMNVNEKKRRIAKSAQISWNEVVKYRSCSPDGYDSDDDGSIDSFLMMDSSLDSSLTIKDSHESCNNQLDFSMHKIRIHSPTSSLRGGQCTPRNRSPDINLETEFEESFTLPPSTGFSFSNSIDIEGKAMKKRNVKEFTRELSAGSEYTGSLRDSGYTSSLKEVEIQKKQEKWLQSRINRIRDWFSRQGRVEPIY
jgi:hypothetical protein